MEDRTREGRKFRTLNVVDEFSRECLAIRVERRLGSTEVIHVLTDLFISRGVPAFVRSDNGPEFVATAVTAWITELGARPAYIEPGTLRWHYTRDASGTFASSAHGKTGMCRASTASSVTSLWPARRSTCWPRPRC